MKRKITTILLSLCMVLTFLPVTAKAEEGTSGNVKEKLDRFIQNEYPVGSVFNETFDGGIQCYGFAKKVINYIFGNYGTRHRSWSYEGISTSGMDTIGSITSYSKEEIKNLLSLAKTGDALQFDIPSQHSMIFYALSDEGVVVYDANYDTTIGGGEKLQNRVSLHTIKYDTLSSWNSNHLTLLRSNNYDEINGPHTHNFTIEGYEEAHPHRQYRKCSCGEFEYTGTNVSLSTCEQCNPPTLIDNLSSQFYCIYEDGTERLIKSGTCLLRNKTTFKSYRLLIQNSQLIYDTKIPEGTYQIFVFCDAENEADNCQGTLDDVTLSNTSNLGIVKLPFNFIKHAFRILDKVTDELLTEVDWELWKGKQRIEAQNADSYMIAGELQVGAEYSLHLHKDGYLDHSVTFTPYYNGTHARILTEVELQPTQGELGNGVQWKFADNTLTFWGNGPITDNPTIPPWGEIGLKDLIHHVQIEPGITRIGDRTAYGQWCYEDLTISIPETVTSIGEVAFGFLHLHNLEIPGSVELIEKSAFDTTNDLTVKFLGNAPSALSDTAFNRASGITVLYPVGDHTWDAYINKDLGAAEKINWVSYQPAENPDPDPDPDPDPNPMPQPDPDYPLPVPVPIPTPQTPDTSSPATQPDGTSSSARPSEWINPYNDISSDAWYYEAVAYAAEHTLLKGVSEDKFAPDNETNRAMAWTILARLSKIDVENGTPWYANAQAWAISFGISDGIAPDRPITRQELITMLYRFSGLPEVTEAQLAAIMEFSDCDTIAPYALQAMAWAVSYDIINGSGGMLLPQDITTRAQIAAILMRFCTKVEA